MFFDLPDQNTLYRALLARDASFDGRAYVGVSSTGVFCRLTCPARKPKAENCTFYATAGDCIEAGFRACKRCHPLSPEASADPAITTLLEALEADPTHRWREPDLVHMGYAPSTIRRGFKRQFGMTFLEMARQRRLRDSFDTLSTGGKVIDTQLDAGFSSPGAFRDAFAKLLGRPPGELKPTGMLLASWIGTPLGDMFAVSSKTHLHLLEFVSRKALPTELTKLQQMTKGDIGIGTYAPTEQAKAELAAFFAGTLPRFETPLALHGTSFTCAVWEALQGIPAGETRTYGQLARDIGKPSATRAVARANGANQVALMIPCHRVLGADGSLTGYGGGLWRKQKLLDIERQYITPSKEKALP